MKKNTIVNTAIKKYSKDSLYKYINQLRCTKINKKDKNQLY